jgi:hypothetical protein
MFHFIEKPMHQRIEFAQEVDRAEVLAAAVAVGQPLPRLARVVEVEHRGDGIDAQGVEVELGQPPRGRGQQEAAHLVAFEIEHAGAPVRMQAEPRVVVLVERGAVEARQRERVAREMAGHPVEDHADAGAVAGIHQVLQVVGAAETGGRREIADALVAPGLVQRVLGQRHELDVRVAEVGGVGQQRVGELAVRIEPAVGMPPP